MTVSFVALSVGSFGCEAGGKPQSGHDDVAQADEPVRDDAGARALEPEVKLAPKQGLDAGRARADVPALADAGPIQQPDAGPSAPGDAGSAGTLPSDEELTCYPLRAHGGDFKKPYQLGVAEDAYTAFTFEAPWKDTAYALLMRPVIDNRKVVHHWILFQDNEPGTPGPGYVEDGAHPNSQILATWLPGSDPLDLRTSGVELGLELPANTTYTLEIHYNSNDASAVDSSGVEVCTSPKKPQHIGSYTWVGAENVGFPAATWSGVCKPSANEPIHIVSIVPHMHLKGTHMKVTVKRAGGALEVVHDHDFDFAYERLYPMQLTLDPGDTMLTECTYSEPKSYGPKVQDEMCYLFTMAYPQNALSSPDLLGAALHGAGSTCLGQ